VSPLATELVARLTRRSLTVAVAESLTGGLVTAELVAVPGASLVLRGGVVAYATGVKASVLGVDDGLLADVGAVDARVAAEMAEGVRARLALDGRPADLGLATTGVAGPEPQDGHPPGEVFLAVADAAGTQTRRLELSGDRAAIRAATVEAALRLLLERVPE